MDEAEQIKRARQGDPAAWIELVGQHQTAVFRLAYLLLGNADDATDVAQEVFLRAFRALGTFDATLPLRPWLLAITRNQACNWRRSLRRYANALGWLVQAVPVEQVVGHGETWDAEALWQAVRQLSTADQEVIYLRYFAELSVEETAQTLQVAPGTVKSRLSRALARLRTIVVHDFPQLGEPGLREEVAE